MLCTTVKCNGVYFLQDAWYLSGDVVTVARRPTCVYKFLDILARNSKIASDSDSDILFFRDVTLKGWCK